MNVDSSLSITLTLTNWNLLSCKKQYLSLLIYALRLASTININVLINDEIRVHSSEYIIFSLHSILERNLLLKTLEKEKEAI